MLGSLEDPLGGRFINIEQGIPAWLSYSPKLIKCCLFVSLCLCGTNPNRCTQRLVTLCAQTY